MAKLAVTALLLLGLLCIQAREIISTDDLRRRIFLHGLSEKDPRCQTNGIVPIPGDCEYYLVCRNGQAIRRKCPDGFYFDTVSYCTPDDRADCGIPSLLKKVLRDLCPRSYGYFVYPNDCHKFVECTDWNAKIRTCPEGLIFRANVGCIEGGHCPPILQAERENDAFQCAEEGRFANPDTCESYIECTVQRNTIEKRLVQCPPGLHYNAERQECDNKCNALCDQDECPCQWPHCLITCEEPFGVFPVPTNCRLYLQCTNNIPSIRSCDDGKAFDTERKTCVDIEETNCVPPTNDLLNVMRS